MAAAGFWDHQETAQAAVANLKSLKAVTAPLDELTAAAEDLTVLLEMCQEEPEMEAEVEQEITRLESLCEDLKLKSMLNGPHDNSGAILTIYARDGGTDANDWAEMLLRMYIQWASQEGHQVSLLDRSDNDIAGINNATICVRGAMAYGYLKGEAGIHRLVRISPFNSEGKRQTSFAAIDISPEISDDIEIEIDEKDVREDTYRASGAGGQHVNTTDSAVRITHMSSGIVVQCQNNRSQHRNKAAALNMLKARLYERELQKREEEAGSISSEKSEIGWGNQIRSYVLHPYHMVKDLRTDVEKGNTQSVLDGGIDEFIEAALSKKIGLKT